jgi:WD40 repeat protein
VAEALDLTTLVSRLRDAGFRTDTRQYLIANELLLALAQQGELLDGAAARQDAARVAACLGPIFCTSPEEQARFPEIVRDWLGTPAGRPAEPHLPRGLPVVATRLLLLAAGPLAAAAVLATLLALPLWWWLSAVELAGLVVRAHVEADGQVQVDPAADAVLTFLGEPVSVDAEGRFALRVPRHARPEPLEARLGDQATRIEVGPDTAPPVVLRFETPAPPPQERPPPQDRLGEPRVFAPPPIPATLETERNMATIGGVASGSGALVFGGLWWLARWRRRAALKRMPVDRRADLRTLAAERAQPPALPLAVARGVVRGLRRPRTEETRDLSVDRTIHATLRTGGLFSPVYVPRRQMPEYLFLIGRHGADDHQARLADALVDQLGQAGLPLERFYFDDDPRACRSARDPVRQRPLAELAGTHHHFTLVIVGDTRALLDPLSGDPAAWTATLAEWPRRVVFTPAPPAQWTRSEWALAATGLTVLPLTAAGLRTYAELAGEWRIEQLFPAPYARAYPALLTGEGREWLAPNAPAPETTGRLLRQLRGYLGPDGFAWLCACAVYPQISWPLTLALSPIGAGTGTADSLHDTLLPQLARLPWFRYGYMPDWLRLALLAQLTPEQETRVRARLATLLQEMAQRAEHPGASGLTVATYAPPKGLLESEPRESRLRDAVFLGFVSGANLDRLSVEAPTALRSLFPGARALPAADMPPPPSKPVWTRVASHLTWLWTFRPGIVRGILAGLAAALALVVSWNAFVIETRTPGGAQVVQALAVSPDGNLVATGTDYGKIWIWDLTQPEAEPVLVYADAPVRALAFGYAPARLAAAGIRVAAEESAPRNLVPRAVQLAAGLEDGNVLFWTVGDATDAIVKVQAHPQPVTSVVFYGDSYLASASERLVVFWDTGTKAPTGERAWTTARVSARLASLGVPGLFALGDADGTVSLFSAFDPQRSRDLRGRGAVTALATAPDGNVLAIARADSPLQLWDARSATILGNIRVDAATTAPSAPADESPPVRPAITAAAFTPDGQAVAAAVSPGKIGLWIAGTGRQVDLPVNAGGDVIGLAFGGREWMVAATASRVRVWPFALPAAGTPVPDQAPQPRSAGAVSAEITGNRLQRYVQTGGFAGAPEPVHTGTHDWAYDSWRLTGRGARVRFFLAATATEGAAALRLVYAGWGEQTLINLTVNGVPLATKHPVAGSAWASPQVDVFAIPPRALARPTDGYHHIDLELDKASPMVLFFKEMELLLGPAPASGAGTPETPPATTVAVPDVTGRPLSEALLILKKQRLEGSVADRASAAADIVVSQRPGAGTRIAAGAKVQLQVARKKEAPTQIRVPDVTGMTLDEARRAIAGAGLVLQAPKDADATGTVRAQKPGAGVNVASGSSVMVDVQPAAPAPGWCCILTPGYEQQNVQQQAPPSSATGEVLRLSQRECAVRGGSFHPTQADARAACGYPPAPAARPPTPPAPAAPSGLRLD